MTIRRSPRFIADIEQTYDWYADNAGEEVADNFLSSVQQVSLLLVKNPEIGPELRSKKERLRRWRYFPVSQPFEKHLIFYEIRGDIITLKRTLHGARNIRRLFG